MTKKFLSVAILGALLLQAFPASADWHHDDHRDDRHDHRWGHGYVVRRIPAYRSIFWHGLGYLYAEGLFYQHTAAGYVIVEPPVGALVPGLPAGYGTVMIAGRPYYYYEDTYYAAAPGGYIVTAPPVAAPAPMVMAPVSVPPAVSNNSPVDTYEIQIPNSDGSYTLVVLKKVEKGFVGPQGEFYPEHPTVEKLKLLYGRK